jgi:hypothetical protein
MPCENYREALIEAAARGSALSRELRLHLDACASCRAASSEELQLFAAIDSGVRTTANAEVPASLLPRVRVQLNERPVPRRAWAPAIVVTAAAVALVAGIVFVGGLERDGGRTNPSADSTAQSIPPTEIPPVPPVAAFSETTSPPARMKRPRPAESPRVVGAAQVAASRVLVPAGQQRAMEVLLASVKQGKVDGVLLTEKPEKTLEELQVSPLAISPIEMKPLEDVSPESAPQNEKTRR